MTMYRINVIGTSGSGKSTFSSELSKALSIKHIEMDKVFWGKDWYWPSDDEFFSISGDRALMLLASLLIGTIAGIGISAWTLITFGRWAGEQSGVFWSSVHTGSGFTLLILPVIAFLIIKLLIAAYLQRGNTTLKSTYEGNITSINSPRKR